MKKIIIVTGASGGIGREFALQLDGTQDCDEFWLVARNAERLTALKEKMRTPARVIAMDLQERGSLRDFHYLLEKEKPEIRTLVNGAGYGKFDLFEDISVEDNLGMIDVNCRALTVMTQICLPYMRRGANIVNVDSLSAFQPLPYVNVYAATKAYVLRFSRALNRELKPKGISVLALCPYWVNTGFFGIANKHGVIKHFDRIYEPDWVVRKAIKAMKKRREVYVPGTLAKTVRALTKVLPHSLVMSIWMKQQKLK